MGRPSKGICIKCEAVKNFRNSTWIEQNFTWKQINEKKKEEHDKQKPLQDMVEDKK